MVIQTLMALVFFVPCHCFSLPVKWSFLKWKWRLSPELQAKTPKGWRAPRGPIPHIRIPERCPEAAGDPTLAVLHPCQLAVRRLALHSDDGTRVGGSAVWM